MLEFRFNSTSFFWNGYGYVNVIIRVANGNDTINTLYSHEKLSKMNTEKKVHFTSCKSNDDVLRFVPSSIFVMDQLINENHFLIYRLLQ